MEVLDGHTAVDQGAAHRSTGACRSSICKHGPSAGERLRGDVAQSFGGHALCRCGQESPHLFSNRERRAWHRRHKTLMGGQP